MPFKIYKELILGIFGDKWWKRLWDKYNLDGNIYDVYYFIYNLCFWGGYFGNNNKENLQEY